MTGPAPCRLREAQARGETRMRRFLTVALLCASPAFARDVPATAQQRQVAIEAYVACQFSYAKTLDDGISDALTIGHAVAASCRHEMENMAAVLTKGAKRDRVRLLLTERFANRAAQEASLIVLQVRTAKSAQQ